MFNSTQQELERECSKVSEMDYVINCINASPEGRTHIRVFELV